MSSPRSRYIEGALVRRADLDTDAVYLEELHRRHRREFHGVPADEVPPEELDKQLGDKLLAAQVESADGSARVVLDQIRQENGVAAALTIETRQPGRSWVASLRSNPAETHVNGNSSAQALEFGSPRWALSWNGLRPAESAPAPDADPYIVRTPNGLEWSLGLPGPKGDRTSRFEIVPASLHPALCIQADGHVEIHDLSLTGRLRFGPIPLDPTDRNFQRLMPAARAAALATFSRLVKITPTVKVPAKVPRGRPFQIVVNIEDLPDRLLWMVIDLNEEVPIASPIENGPPPSYSLPLDVPGRPSNGEVKLRAVAAGSGQGGRWKSKVLETKFEVVDPPRLTLKPAAIPAGVQALGGILEIQSAWSDWSVQVDGQTIDGPLPLPDPLPDPLPNQMLNIAGPLLANDKRRVTASYKSKNDPAPAGTLDELFKVSQSNDHHFSAKPKAFDIRLRNQSSNQVTGNVILVSGADALSVSGADPQSPTEFDLKAGKGVDLAVAKPVDTGSGKATVVFDLAYQIDGIGYKTSAPFSVTIPVAPAPV